MPELSIPIHMDTLVTRESVNDESAASKVTCDAPGLFMETKPRAESGCDVTRMIHIPDPLVQYDE
jgi:hypothetical protein